MRSPFEPDDTGPGGEIMKPTSAPRLDHDPKLNEQDYVDQRQPDRLFDGWDGSRREQRDGDQERRVGEFPRNHLD